jgi:hypothetical protein
MQRRSAWGQVITGPQAASNVEIRINTPCNALQRVIFHPGYLRSTSAAVLLLSDTGKSKSSQGNSLVQFSEQMLIAPFLHVQ